MAHAKQWYEDVPTFDNNVDNYKQYKQKANMYWTRMKLDGKGKQVALNLLSKLTGTAWDACEELVDEPSSMEDEKTAFGKLMACLDKRFERSKFTKLP